MEAYWYFDFASPFSYLQLAKVREWRSRLPVTPVPILARSLPKVTTNTEVPAVEDAENAVDRFVRWRAKAAGITLNFPNTYPFNSFAALRLCVAAGNSWTAIGTIFEHLWRDGNDGMLAHELVSVGTALGLADPIAAITAADSAAAVRASTIAALALGITSVPAVRIGGKLFSGSQAADEVDAFLALPPMRRTA